MNTTVSSKHTHISKQGVFKSIWLKPEMKDCTIELRNIKRPRRPSENLANDRIFTQKYPFSTISHRTHPPGGLIICVKVNNHERSSPKQIHYKMVNLKNRKTRLEFNFFF